MSEKILKINYLSPGEAIRNLLLQRGWTQEDLAEIISKSLKHVNEIIKDKRSLTLDFASLLAATFQDSKGSLLYTVSDWMELNTKFQLSQSKESQNEFEVKNKVKIYEYMPISELIKKGWLKSTDKYEELEKEIKKFWSLPIDKPLDLSFLKENAKTMRFRKSDAHGKASEYSASIWKQKIIHHIKKYNTSDFDKQAFSDLMKSTHYHTTKKDGIRLFLNELEKVGVSFAFLPHLNKTYLDGATFVYDGKPVIALSGRYDRVDNFWFTLTHEAFHVLEHLELDDSSSEFFDDSSADIGTEKEERDADKYASEILLRNEIIEYFKRDVHYMSDSKIKLFADYRSIHPSIVVGILAYEKMIHFSKSHRYKESVRDKIPTKYKAD